RKKTDLWIGKTISTCFFIEISTNVECYCNSQEPEQTSIAKGFDTKMQEVNALAE
ncbi:hypothetical protein BDF14DRAFT_1721569, partial [Spinellus fusiger]